MTTTHKAGPSTGPDPELDIIAEPPALAEQVVKHRRQDARLPHLDRLAVYMSAVTDMDKKRPSALRQLILLLLCGIAMWLMVIFMAASVIVIIGLAFKLLERL